jgi:hypothetical protein
MAGKILVLAISCVAIAAGWQYVWTAQRMRTFETTRGKVIGREIEMFHRREGRFGKGGGHRPIATYTYWVGGATYTSDRWSYVTAGLKRHVVQRMLDALPDEVDVHYNPAKPQEAYLHTNTPRWGYVMVAGGVIGVLVSAALLFA